MDYWGGRFNLYYHTTNSYSEVMGRYNKIGMAVRSTCTFLPYVLHTETYTIQQDDKRSDFILFIEIL